MECRGAQGARSQPFGGWRQVGHRALEGRAGDLPVAVRAVAERDPATAEQASELARWIEHRRPAPHVRPARQPRLVLVTGGKGGVGKSNFSLNFALALQQRGRRVLLVDCDAGMGNLDVLLGLAPSWHLGDVLSRRCRLAEALVELPAGLRLLPAAADGEAWGLADAAHTAELVAGLGELADGFDLHVVDTGAGLGPQVRMLLRAAGEILLVTTPEPTALADAYATVKTIRGDNRHAQTRVVVNMAENRRDAEAAMRTVSTVSRQFLDWTPGYLGAIPRDPAVTAAVRQQKPFLLASPFGPAAQALRALAAAFCAEEAQGAPSGLWALAGALMRAGRSVGGDGA